MSTSPPQNIFATSIKIQKVRKSKQLSPLWAHKNAETVDYQIEDKGFFTDSLKKIVGLDKPNNNEFFQKNFKVYRSTIDTDFNKDDFILNYEINIDNKEIALCEIKPENKKLYQNYNTIPNTDKRLKDRKLLNKKGKKIIKSKEILQCREYRGAWLKKILTKKNSLLSKKNYRNNNSMQYLETIYEIKELIKNKNNSLVLRGGGIITDVFYGVLKLIFTLMISCFFILYIGWPVLLLCGSLSVTGIGCGICIGVIAIIFIAIFVALNYSGESSGLMLYGGANSANWKPKQSFYIPISQTLPQGSTSLLQNFAKQSKNNMQRKIKIQYPNSQQQVNIITNYKPVNSQILQQQQQPMQQPMQKQQPQTLLQSYQQKSVINRSKNIKSGLDKLRKFLKMQSDSCYFEIGDIITEPREVEKILYEAGLKTDNIKIVMKAMEMGVVVPPGYTKPEDKNLVSYFMKVEFNKVAYKVGSSKTRIKIPFIIAITQDGLNKIKEISTKYVDETLNKIGIKREDIPRIIQGKMESNNPEIKKYLIDLRNVELGDAGNNNNED